MLVDGTAIQLEKSQSRVEYCCNIYDLHLSLSLSNIFKPTISFSCICLRTERRSFQTPTWRSLDLSGQHGPQCSSWPLSSQHRYWHKTPPSATHQTDRKLRILTWARAPTSFCTHALQATTVSPPVARVPTFASQIICATI
jgi:hypothetical protein